jgi:DNA repair protein RecO (recombination protein O)
MSAPSHGSDPAPNEAPRAPSPSASRRAAGATHSAFVLHSHDWSESSLIVELFTRDGGRIVAMAKGAKRPTSHLRSVLMPFQPVQAQFVRSRGDDGEVRTLRNAEWGGGAVAALRGAEWFAAFYLNELLLRLLARDDPHPRLFDAYAATLCSLGGNELRSEAALRAFELLLLRETGVLPELARTTQTQEPVVAGTRYALRAEQGLVAGGRWRGCAGGCGVPGAGRRRSSAGRSSPRPPCRRCTVRARVSCSRSRPCCAASFTIIWAARCCARGKWPSTRSVCSTPRRHDEPAGRSRSVRTRCTHRAVDQRQQDRAAAQFAPP